MSYLLIYFSLLTVLYFLLFQYYHKGWKRTPLIPSTPPNSWTRFSIIIPARNEENNIANCLNSIVHNSYPFTHYEIIVINDFSEDKTAKIVTSFCEQYPHIHLLELKDHIKPEDRINAFKKEALNLAIHQAEYPWIITTDADCLAPQNWLNTFNNFILNHTEAKFIAAPVSLIPVHKKGALYYFQSIDFLTMQGITAASVQLNLGSMANGANLAFNQQAFFEVDGYKGIDHIASGDDMLLMQKIRKAYPLSIYFLKNETAIIETYDQKDIRSFLNQRIRWASKSGTYEEKKLQSTLLLVYLFNLSLLLLFIISFFSPTYFILFFIILIIKILIELPFIHKIATFFGKNKEVQYYPFLQIFHIVYIVTAGFLGLLGSYEWKGRKVR